MTERDPHREPNESEEDFSQRKARFEAERRESRKQDDREAEGDKVAALEKATRVWKM